MSLINLPLTTLLTPELTTPLLLTLLYYPSKLRSLLPATVHPLLDIVLSSSFLAVLKTFVGLGVLKRGNAWLEKIVVNNWTRVKFVKSSEVVVVTGGASGIGLLIAKDFVSRGVKVIILDLHPPKTSMPPGVLFYQADVTKSADISTVAAQIRKAHGDPTVLINNAGIGSAYTILSGTEEMTRKTFEVNTISHFVTAREFLPAMIKKNHGHVVTVASMASFVTIAGNVDYSCTKAAALAFHEGLTTELKTRYNAPNVRTTVVHPSWVRTPLTEEMVVQPSFTDPVLEPEQVSSVIVKQIVDGQSGQIIIPKEMSMASTVRGWPTWLQNYLRNKQSHTLDFPVDEISKVHSARAK